MATQACPPLRDSKLSEQGEANARLLADKIGSFPELVVSSPFSSALQTALLIFGSPSRRIVPHKSLRETPKSEVRPQSIAKPQKEEHKGRLKSELMRDAALVRLGATDFVAWDDLEDGEWWSNTVLSTAESVRESASFKEWLLGRPESRIAVVGHAGKFLCMVKDKPPHWPKNSLPYYCYLVMEGAGGLSRGDLIYGGTNPLSAAASIPKGVRSKCVMLLRNSRTVAQDIPSEKMSGKRKSVASSDAPPKLRCPSAPSSATSPAAPPPMYHVSALVTVHGIEKKPELNGKIGQVTSFDGGNDRRYTVRIDGALVSLREDKLSLAPSPRPASRKQSSAKVKAANTKAKKAKDSESEKSEIEDYHKLPLGKVTPQGILIPSYKWVSVPKCATLPPGLEVRMPFSDAQALKCARIPSSWRLQVVAEGQCEAYRQDVNRRTSIREVLSQAASMFGWTMDSFQLLVDGSPREFSKDATVRSAALFGRKLTARKKS
eukprot:TRINITY_DN27306_c0_g4_i1.p1 TRINITY_DN27306_c0_g4~~TRINITY_DN27306_c0_g4_i1.p1  ORF type:complete len:497 (-),score=40.20 TRINITY_DN27306_c0_g4_i1:9-1478(-)